MNIRGELGHLLVDYRWAARLGRWSLQSTTSLGAPAATVSAKVEKIDEYWAHQGPMRLALWLGRAYWVWDGVVVHPVPSNGGHISIELRGDPTAQPTLKGMA